MAIGVVRSIESTHQTASLLSIRNARLIQGLLLLSAAELAVISLSALERLTTGNSGRITPPGEFAEAIPSLAIARVVWPILLACMMRKLTLPRLQSAAGVTALAFLCDRALGLLRGGFLSLDRNAARWGSQSAEAIVAALPFTTVLAGACNLAVCAIAALMLHAAFAGRKTKRTEPAPRQSTRWLQIGAGTTVLAASALFLSVLASQSWPIYLELVNRMPEVRSWVLGPQNTEQTRSRPPVDSPRALALHEANMLIALAGRYVRSGDAQKAKAAYHQGIDKFTAHVKKYADDQLPADRSKAIIQNNLAWMLVVSPKLDDRDPDEAVALATVATKANPHDGTFWNTLGVAQYRAGDLDAATKAFERSMNLRRGGDSYDWFFLAMIEHKRGNPAEAKRWFDRASESINGSYGFDPAELRRFQIEAAETIGVPVPTDNPAPAPRQPQDPRDGLRSSSFYYPFGPRRRPNAVQRTSIVVPAAIR
jgi:tetratricopeptide (TPR) repeat protein